MEVTSIPKPKPGAPHLDFEMWDTAALPLKLPGYPQHRTMVLNPEQRFVFSTLIYKLTNLKQTRFPLCQETFSRPQQLQIPPLRCAPVGMTKGRAGLFYVRQLVDESGKDKALIGASPHRFRPTYAGANMGHPWGVD